MYQNDDKDVAKTGDRVIASVVGGVCGFFLGGLLGYLVNRFAGIDLGLAWWFALGFAVYAFLAPSRSTQIWSEFWEALLGVFSRVR